MSKIHGGWKGGLSIRTTESSPLQSDVLVGDVLGNEIANIGNVGPPAEPILDHVDPPGGFIGFGALRSDV